MGVRTFGSKSSNIRSKKNKNMLIGADKSVYHSNVEFEGFGSALKERAKSEATKRKAVIEKDVNKRRDEITAEVKNEAEKRKMAIKDEANRRREEVTDEAKSRANREISKKRERIIKEVDSRTSVLNDVNMNEPGVKKKRITLDKEMTRSVTALQNRKREYVVLIDLDESSGKNVEEISDVLRGEKGSVIIPAHKTDEIDVLIHNHPPSDNYGKNRWNGPSGGDVSSMLRLSLASDLDEAFIIGPDKRYYRFYLKSAADPDMHVIIAKLNSDTAKGEINEALKEMRNEERNWAHLNYQERKRAMAGKMSVTEINRLNARRFKMKSSHLELTTHRRLFKRYQKYLDDDWNVKLERLDKKPVRLHFEFK